jgi:hypothetical protein
MFDDQDPLRQLYASVVSGEGPEDLEMVRGDRLSLIAPCPSSGAWELGALTSVDDLCELADRKTDAALESITLAGDSENLSAVIDTARRLTHRAIRTHLTWNVA